MPERGVERSPLPGRLREGERFRQRLVFGGDASVETSPEGVELAAGVSRRQR